MKPFNLASALFFLTLTAWSQNSNFTMDVSQLRSETVYFDIEGSPYFDDVYRLGQVYFRGEKYLLFFRFNALEDRVELKDRTRRLFHLQKNAILEPTFDGKTYQYLYYLEGDALERGYLVPLVKGKELTLYFKPRKVYEQAKSPAHGYEGFTPPKYRDVSGYFLQYGRELPRPLKLGKRQVLEVLKDKETEIESYVLQQQLDLRKEADVVRLLHHYNRIN